MATAEDVIGDAEKQSAHDMHGVQNTGLQWIATNISEVGLQEVLLVA